MWCKNASNQLSALVDGELEPTQERAVRNHVDNCPRCAQELIRTLSLVELTRGIPMEAVPAGLYSRTLTRLAYADVTPVAMVPARRRYYARGMGLWPALAGAAAAIVIVGVMRPPHGAVSRQPAPSGPTPAVTVKVIEPPVATALQEQPAPRVAVRAPQPRVEAAEPVTATPAISPSVVPPVTRVASVTRPNRPAPRSTPADAVPATGRGQGSATTGQDTGGSGVQLEQPDRDSTPAPVMAEVPTAPATADEARPENPDTMAAAIDRDSTMRMAGFTPDVESTTGEDEGAQMLRMYLSERNRTVPQPPAIGMGRRRRSQPL